MPSKPGKPAGKPAETVTISIKPPRLILDLVELVAKRLGMTRHEWILGAIRTALLNDPIECLRLERRELAERLEQVDEALRKALKGAERGA